MSLLSKEVIDKLTPWLLSNLHSDDLDAKDMADYVVSLISAPGNQEQLYSRCRSELEEFLGPQTESFVDALFQQISKLTQPEDPNQQIQPNESTSQGFPNAQPSQDEPLSGGQQEFRRNFRDNFTPFTPQQQQFSQAPQQQQQQHHHHQQQQQQQQQPPANFQSAFSMPPPPPQGMPVNGFPPFMGMPPSGMPPQFGFQGFGRPGKALNYRNNNNNMHHNGKQRRMHSSLSSVQNELSVANKRLVVEQIPAEHLNKESIEQFFGKFGRLTNVKINEQQNLAEIEFEGHDQAVEAHKSPEPIFGNRFVKVFWRKRLESEEQPELDVEAVRRIQAIKQQQFEEKEAKRKELTTNLRSVLNEQGSILQQRQQILQSGQPDTETLNQLQARSEELSTHLKQLKQELAVLQGAANGGSAAGPSRGGYRGRGASPYSRGGRAPRGSFRGGYMAPHVAGGANRFSGASLDRRPKGVLIQGIPPEKDEILRGELASRSYTDYQRQSDNSVIVDFADRRSAEEFYNHEIPELGSVSKSLVRVDSNHSSADSSMMSES